MVGQSVNGVPTVIVSSTESESCQKLNALSAWTKQSLFLESFPLATADLLGPVCPDWVTSQQVSELREKWLVCVPLPEHTFCRAALSQAGISQSIAADAVRRIVLVDGVGLKNDPLKH